ncbi:MAG TPA: peptide chain release factor N(5)-glutamine methyltransferase [Candidatus Gallimonas intestinigallinarum]|uniref:Release factor glutamine methyltransferase n=1 Tax=Candidatus Gallimonas intestinigallinarum TaxID=2838604 RepID=A0A9D2IVZ4_9FIRM|nr:peptide chain release factor N(5)-glutamine methyltransferase [Candidatus Gallimonas intestinigallinarum]
MRKKTQRTHIGGQAVIQGVMMLSKCGMATAVRDDTGEMQTEAIRLTPPEQQAKWKRLPFVRGVVSFVSSLVLGMGALMRSSDVAFTTEEEEPSNLSKWMTEKLKVSVGEILSVISTILGVVLALALFLLLPNYLTSLIADAAPAIGGTGSIWYNLIDGGFRLVIFLCYILFTLLFKSLRETYQYHGAEHNTINCYEYGDELTVENVKKASRLHDRCGTTFIFLVLIVSILIFALVNWALAALHWVTGIGWADDIISFIVKIIFLPVVAGISYEVLRLLSKTDSVLVLPLKAPGYLLQKLTTREPDDPMIECAIAAFKKAKEMEDDPNSPERSFVTETKLSKLLETMKSRFEKRGIDASDAEWIVSLTLDIPRSALSQERIVSRKECREIVNIFDERMTGRPLWYIFGDTDFCGCKIKVDERVLIPRPETELLVRQALAALKDGDSMLDLCTGSGAIAVAVAVEAAKKKSVTIVGADISEDALEVARENARINQASVTFVKADLFDGIRGKFDLITANPPYIKSGEIASLDQEVRDFEPRIALDGGEDGLDFYRRIAERIRRYIVRGGMCIMECGEGQAQEIIRIFRETARCDFAMVVRDDAGVERIVKIGF